MVHSKVVVIDHRFADVGSANFTALSHGVYDEINLRRPRAVRARARGRDSAALPRRRAGQDWVGYKRLGSGIEKAIVAYQSRRGG